jgi:hypothetical protein
MNSIYRKNMIVLGVSVIAATAIFYWLYRPEKFELITDLEDHKRLWFEENSPLGTDLGYPACCIQAFCDQPPILLRNSAITDDDFARYKAAHIDGKYTGFIPCVSHARQVLSGKSTLSSLIQNRNKDFPDFPNY